MSLLPRCVLRLSKCARSPGCLICRAKQSQYFPEVKGYRFSGGSAGIYLGAKDLFVSEISGVQLFRQLIWGPGMGCGVCGLRLPPCVCIHWLPC